MSDPTPDDEREGFVRDNDTGEWVRKEQVVKLSEKRFVCGWMPFFAFDGQSLLGTLKDICSIARVDRDKERLEEIRKAGEVAGWYLQDLDYEEQEHGKNER